MQVQLHLFCHRSSRHSRTTFPALWDNIYIQGGASNISKLTTYVAQASALDRRITNGYSGLKSIGGVFANEASFQKRLLSFTSGVPSANNVVPTIAQASSTGLGAYDERDVFKPYAGAVAGTPRQTLQVPQ